MAAGATRATVALEKAAAAYRVHRYDVSEKVGEGYGEAVAAAIGMGSARVFKTLVAVVDGQPVIAVIPVDRRLSTKRLAGAIGGKHGSLAPPSVAERETGYVTGGISPFGQRKRHRLVLDSSALEHQTIAVSGGQRGLQLELSPQTILDLTDASIAVIVDV
ncbi:MAG TPA: Cys-tRNA(Pro) deacylase [Acidimicrobiia bacterium]|jgi:Cys-tRNA(Pro)/Cys-tRNA(Cys) deacylase|nr:ybaK/ebsC protein [Acidimicrobiia bacterium]HYJ25556.1 Cys-tRNA(Pro) deacylase [Acidimicrobiia bacterium]